MMVFRKVSRSIISTPASLFLLLLLLLFCTAKARVPKERSVRVFNNSGQTLEIYWIPPNGGDPVLQSAPVVYASHVFQRSSYVGHVFEIRTIAQDNQCDDSPTTNSHHQECPSSSTTAQFVVSDHDDQVIRVLPQLELLVSDNLSQARDEANRIIEHCRQTVIPQQQQQQQQPQHDSNNVQDLVEQLEACVKEGQGRAMAQANEEIQFQSNLRVNMALLLENYTCHDDELETTDELYSEQWRDPRTGGITYSVQVLHERPTSTIRLVQDFIGPDECAAIEEAVKDRLQPAGIVDGDGRGATQESVRKAMDAPVQINWKNGPAVDPIVRLGARIYDYANYVMGEEILPQGQEDLIAIFYEGRDVMNETEEPDQYKRHCDGPCFGEPYSPGDRIASMVMYCEIPETGGAMNFQRAGVLVRPDPGDAVFFSYVDPILGQTDTGWTEHSGCPVIKGSKKIVTQWLRMGVDGEHPWYSFDAHASRKKPEEQEGEREEANARSNEL